MKVAIVFLAVLAVTFSSSGTSRNRKHDPREEDMYRIRYLPRLNDDEHLYYEDLLQKVPTTRASASHLTFYLYTTSNPKSPNLIAGNESDSFTPINFESSRPSVFVIHGWNNNYASKVNSYIVSALLGSHNVNIFVSDWSSIANGLYGYAFSQVPSVGEVIGDFIYALMNRFNIGASSFYLIGHSLGAHVAGCAGARVNILSNSSVSSIVGLDPAGPLFTIGNIDNRIDPTDAQFVQVIHTSGFLGFGSAIGHADYYPNGGYIQAGCGIDLVGTCSHSRAYKYFAESIISSGFNSLNCENYEGYTNGECNGNRQSSMGRLYVDTGAVGDYYLNTNRKSPFAQG